MPPEQYFDDALLQEYMHTFFGYGNFASSYWFVGMEEGSDGSFTEIARRIACWKQRGQVSLEDMIAYHNALGITGLFGPRARLQPTWNKLIRIILSAKRQPVHRDYVRAYQAQHLGILEGENCLIELLPLPSPSTSHWIYGIHSHLPELTTRTTYMQHWRPKRIAYIRGLIKQHRPQAVIFYSVNPMYQESWRAIAQIPFTKRMPDGVQIGNNGHTVFVITKHPVTQGVTNAYFHTVGNLIAEQYTQIGQK